jgi:hypothetical protein
MAILCPKVAHAGDREDKVAIAARVVIGNSAARYLKEPGRGGLRGIDCFGTSLFVA